MNSSDNRTRTCNQPTYNNRQLNVDFTKTPTSALIHHHNVPDTGVMHKTSNKNNNKNECRSRSEIRKNNEQKQQTERSTSTDSNYYESSITDLNTEKSLMDQNFGN